MQVSNYNAEEDARYLPAIQSVSSQATEIAEAAKESLDFLAALAMPTVYKYAYPPVLLAAWQWLTGHAHTWRTFPRLALGIPRGFSKTTLIKIFVLYCILFTERKFILITASTAKMAENILADIVDMLDEPNIKAVFGDWRLGIIKDTQSLKKFGFRGRAITLAGIGAGGSLRGLNIKNERPDVMVFEDIQSAEDAESQTVSETLLKWLLGTAIKAKSPEGCMYLFIANMYATPYSILRKLKADPNWIKFITGGILADGTSLWEELHPLAQLLAEFQSDLAQGYPQIFYSEVLNDEHATSNNLIDTSKIPEFRRSEADVPIWKYIIVDPSGNKLHSDLVSVGAFYAYERGQPVFREVVEGRFSPKEIITTALKMALKHGAKLVVYEAVAFQESLNYWHEFLCQQLGIEGIRSVGIYPGGMSKNSRIIKTFRPLLNGEIELHPDVRPLTFMQLMQFRPDKTDNNDGILDLIVYAPRVPVEFSELAMSTSIIEQQEFEANMPTEEWVPDF